MINLNFENFFANFSFLLLLLSMIFYWIKTVFITQIKNFKYEKLGILFSNISLFSFLILRWKESGHFPLSNLYESLMFLSWSITIIHLILEKISNNPFIGTITAPCALFTNAFATISLPSNIREAAPLVPALQSNWLMMHVTVMILSYAALITGSLLSIAFLIITQGQNVNLERNRLKTNSSLLFFNPDVDRDLSPSFSSTEDLQNVDLIKLAKTLDNLSYRILGIGFPFLTIGILSGAVWANEAWGSYWSWDPKETWALLTWFVFAVYLHTRLTQGWQGKKPAILATVGFFTVWICYLGVNLLGEGLHSYGWIHQS